MPELTPREIVKELDRHIIGQDDAKRAVAIAIRNRWRRQQLDDEMREEVAPKRIMVSGGSQGGGPSMVLVALDRRTAFAAPAHSGAVSGRHGREHHSERTALLGEPGRPPRSRRDEG